MLGPDFYSSFDTLNLAKQLLGKELIHESPYGICSGIIVETEAYLFNDPACHAFNKRTPRNEPMFGQAGTVYVYQIYGMYHCFNVVSGKTGIGEAVLIRALQPVQGLDLMKKRRGKERELDLCSGPGKLVSAIGIVKHLNFHSLASKPFYLIDTNFEIENIISTTRIGIAKGKGDELPYRFYVSNNKYISKK